MAFAIPLVVAVAVEASAFVIAGAALGAVGGLTGNKELGIIGGLIGLAGGFFAGGLGGAEGLAGAEGAGVAGLGTNEAAGALSAAESAGGAVADLAAATPAAPTNVLAGVDAAGEAVNNTLSQGGAIDPATPTGSPTMPEGTPSMIDKTGVGGDGTLYAENNPLNPDVSATGSSPFAKAIDGGKTAAVEKANPGGILDRFQTWFKDNPALAKMGGDFVKGGFDGAQKNKQHQELMEIRQRMMALQEREQQLKQGNASYVPSSLGMSFNNSASLYPQGAGPASFRFGILNNNIRSA